MKIDESKTYATVHGHPFYCFQQGERFYDGAKNEIDNNGDVIDPENPKDPKKSDDADKIIQTDGVASAEAFLKQILSGGPVAKASIYKEAENTLIKWPDVQKAYTTLGIIKTQRANKNEFWQLPESTGK